ncbi:ENTH/VHS family protein, putative isoform 3 [Hibiscus syriacus]|uniref:ENTH/VHS family protein, putative isoform 3 n=1 Tax=Hibiscus syriacus TaxID=106335 RepID=A0A6A3CBW4_HIBSY|nr:ENTH/VHS family protein, putative isoform 3 [Hibiscus syriacus]
MDAVFCKAYRQVDPPVRQSMWHPFGTWKGVFPPPTLQEIEKELGFAPMINGSSSGTTTSRPDPLSQRQPHSIHVNPKNLERQRLQQSSRAKGMVNDMTRTLANSKEDYKRPDREAITAGRPYGNPSVKMNNIRCSYRDAFNYAVCDKIIGVTFGTYDYGSYLSQTNGVGVGRASVTEAISSQRNGFNIKPGSQNYLAFKSVNADPRLLARQNIAGKSSNAMPSCWKNSEEEEFMWEMHSRLSQHNATNISNNSRKDHWILDASEKLDLESPFRKAQSIHDVGSGFDRETSCDSLSTEQKEKTSFGRQISSEWPFQESHKTDGLPAFSSSYSATIGGLPSAASSSLARIEKRPQRGKLDVGSLKHSHQVSSALISRSSHDNSLPQPPKPDHAQAESSGQTQKPLLSRTSEVGTASIFGNASGTNPLAIKTSEPSSTSSLLAAVMKSGILSNNSLIGSLPNKIPSRSLPGIFTSSSSASHDPIATTTNSFQGKVEQLPPSSVVNNAQLQTSDPESKASIPKSPERERPSEPLNKSLEISTSSPAPAPSIPSSSDAPHSSSMDEVSFALPATKSSVASHQSASVELENLIGLEFTPDVVREFHSSVISGLLDNRPYCCSFCALRGWYARSDDWIAGKPGQLAFEPTKSVKQSEMTADRDEEWFLQMKINMHACYVVSYSEDFFSQDRGKWMFKGAVYLTIPSQDGQGGTTYETAAKGPVVHAHCMLESSVHDLFIKMLLLVRKKENNMPR